MSQSIVPDILLTPYVLYDIVSSERIDKFDLAIGILEELVFFGCSSHVSIPGGTKLLIAMKLKYVLEQIRKKSNSVAMVVEKYFPPRGKYKQGNALYREFLNILIEEKELQERFFETEYTREFGSEFFNNLTRMTENLVLKIVPISEIVKQMHAGTSYLLDRLNLLSTKKNQNIGDIQSALSLSFSYSSKAYTSFKEKEVDNLCSDKAFAVYLETTDDTQEEHLTKENDLDKVIPPSVEASPEYPELDIFEEEASYLDNTVQNLPDFTRFLKQLDPIE